MWEHRVKMRLLWAMLVAIHATLAGCATNPVVGHGTSQTGRYRGDVGITGNGTELTIQAGSNVSKLSIVGDACIVNLEDGGVVRRIEFWGTANTVTIPEKFNPIIASVGVTKVEHRPAGEALAKHGQAATSPAGE